MGEFKIREVRTEDAGRLAEIARGYECRMTVSAGKKSASADSPLELMGLGASQGTVLKVSAEGRDAKAGLKAVREYLEQTL